MAPPSLSQAERDALVEANLEYVRSLAAQLRRDLGADLDLEEMVACGMKGLVEAAQRFDPTRGAAFTTFAYYRIRGSIFDGLRKSGFVGRADYARFQAGANALLENLHEREPAQRSTSSTARVAELGAALDQLATIFITSMDAGTGPEIADQKTPSADEVVEGRQRSAALRGAIAGLPERERALIEARYYDELTLVEAGARLGLSKSWASRLHARAVKLLTDALGPAFALED